VEDGHYSHFQRSWRYCIRFVPSSSFTSYGYHHYGNGRRATPPTVACSGSTVTHELLFRMHREILKGATGFPADSIGAYVGDMKIVSGTRMDREPQVIHRG